MRAANIKSGQMIGDYRLLAVVGKGATGTVYKAEPRQTTQIVALKVIADHYMADERSRLRFAQECQLSRQLVHPHIVAVLDFGLAGDKAYLAMEFVEGPNLGERIQKSGPLPEAEALRIIGQVGAALTWAHERRLLHRDVKPDNVLLGADGMAKLTDLGLAKNLEDDQNLTKTNAALGTPNFMAPEQFEDAAHATVRSDVYGLGATLYMMVTGELPFRAHLANAFATIYKKQITNDIIDPRQVVPTLSETVVAAILRAMRANPDERFADVPEFLAALAGKVVAPAAAPKAAGPATASTPVPVTVTPAAIPTPPSTSRGRKERRNQRFSCRRAIHSRVLNRSRDTDWQGEIVNISESGVCLLLNRSFHRGTLLTLALESDKSKLRSVVVRVMWVQPEARMWRIGCEFDQPLAEFQIAELQST